jgi:hypothetical protein
MSQHKKFIFGTIREFDRAKVEESRTIEFIISSAAKDRHRSVVNMDGWHLDNFNRNPIVGYQHNVYGGNMCTPDDPDDVIGSGRAWVEEIDGQKLLIGEVKFEPADINPKAEKIFRKVLAGTLRATSVGFMEIGKGEWRKNFDDNGNELDRTYYFKGQDLLEFSIVNIPSNPEAVGRSVSVQTDFALAYVMRFFPEDVSIKDIKQMTVQQVLDQVAGKASEIPTDPPEGKSKALFERRLKRILSDIQN